jgi:hypothetical protein
MGSPGPGIVIVILYCFWFGTAVPAVVISATYLSTFWCVATIIVCLAVLGLMVWKLTPKWRELSNGS